MTPVDLRRAIRGAEVRWQDDHDRQIVAAWQTAALTAHALNGTLPSLRSLLQRSHGPVTPKQHQLQLAQLSEHLGIAFQPLSAEARAALDRLRKES